MFFFFRINIDDIRTKLSSSSKIKKVENKIDDQRNEDDFDDYELGKDIKDEKKRKA